MTTISLDGVANLTGVLQRLPQGTQARALMEKMGLWSSPMHVTAAESRRAVFPHEFSRLADTALSDQNAYWLSEVFRTTELVGLLEGQRTVLNLQSKSTRASVRARLRRAHREASLKEVAAGRAALKDPTAAQLNDEVEEDPSVLDGDATLAMLSMVLESAKAYKEACLASTAGLSREISFRQAQMGAKLR